MRKGYSGKPTYWKISRFTTWPELLPPSKSRIRLEHIPAHGARPVAAPPFQYSYYRGLFACQIQNDMQSARSMYAGYQFEFDVSRFAGTGDQSQTGWQTVLPLRILVREQIEQVGQQLSMVGHSDVQGGQQGQ